jgi:hypothetical protein
MTLIKPTNLKQKGCSPVSSNCVVWQGDDIPCLKICKGDTISDVMFKLACLVCAMKDQLDVDNYDLTCWNLDKCDIPHTFKEFMNLVIQRICDIEALIGTPQGEVAGEAIIITASCFQAELGMTAGISAYVAAIGQKLCEQELLIQNQQLAIQQLLTRVEILEGV